MSGDDVFMTRSEVASLCRASVRTVEKWAYDGTGPDYFRVGRNTLYRRADVEAWLEDRRVAA